ncbi:MAG: DegT/DnrJ/EryC1/StrS family aminotransferase [Microgenomates group bacterium]
MKHVFDDLGVQYTLKDSLKLLINWISPKSDAQIELKNEIEKAFKGEAILVNKGRDAIELALRATGVKKGDLVGTQAFSCAAIEEAIVRTGAKPLYIDLDPETSTISVKTIEKAIQKSKKPKVMILQHTLGVPGDSEAISDWCVAQKVLLIEDLAQAVGAVSKTQKPLGFFGKMVILSFGRDKILDGASGGALVLKSDQQRQLLDTYLADHPLKTPPWKSELKETLYPLLTWKIRTFYPIGLGKLLHFLSKKMNLMTSSTISTTSAAASFQPQFANLVLKRWKNLDDQLSSRKKIIKIYHKLLSGKSFIKWEFSNEDLERGSGIRYAVGVENPAKLIAFMNLNGVHIADRWYRSAVDCGSGRNCKTTYKSSSCHVAENRAKTVINLPTHRLITPEIATEIAKQIIKFYA